MHHGQDLEFSCSTDVTQRHVDVGGLSSVRVRVRAFGETYLNPFGTTVSIDVYKSAGPFLSVNATKPLALKTGCCGLDVFVFAEGTCVWFCA